MMPAAPTSWLSACCVLIGVEREFVKRNLQKLTKSFFLLLLLLLLLLLCANEEPSLFSWFSFLIHQDEKELVV
jgi:hypothetical protein